MRPTSNDFAGVGMTLEETAVQRHYGCAGPNDNGSRTVIDIALGVLVGLRGCAPEEAFAELVEVVHSSGIGIGSLSTALIALAGGTSGSAAEHAEAFNAWGPLISAARPRPVDALR
jgi:hypothetical protein